MDENGKRIQREIAKDKIQIILSSIAVAVLIIMELYIMINYKSNFLAMAVGILLMIIALFFLISGVLDMSLKSKDMEEQKYEDIYNAQKASYLVIRKSFEELDQRLRSIEENSALPAEDIINAQKAVAKVTISRSKENTDALMNSNDELINQILAIKDKLENNNNSILEKQQSLLKETNFDIQQKIAELTSQLSSIEGRIQGGMSAMAAQPVQVVVPPVVAEPAGEPVAPVAPVAAEPVAAPVPEEISVAEEMPVMDEIPAAEEMPVIDEIPAAEEMPVMDEMPVAEEMPVMDEIPAVEEEPVEDLGLDLDTVVEEEAPADDLGLDLDAVVEEEAPVDDLGLDLDAVVEEEAPAEELLEIPDGEPVLEAAVEEPAVEEPVAEEAVEIPAEEPVIEEAVEIPAKEPVVEEAVEIPAEEPVVEEAVEIPAEEPVAEETIEIPAEEPAAQETIELTAAEPSMDDVAADLDALLEEVGGPVEEEPAPEPEPEPPAEETTDEVVIPDVGVDLTDPNRVMSAEEIEKLFASI